MQREDERAVTQGRGDRLADLLDPVVGFFVWALHFIAIYSVQSVTCVLAGSPAGAAALAPLRIVLVALTFAALALIAVHALRAYRRRSTTASRFMHRLTLGNDAVAAAGVSAQFYPIWIEPLCR